MTRTFDQTRKLAKHLGNQLQVLYDKLPYRDSPDGAYQQAAKLTAISQTMDLIAGTANASVSPEVMALFNAEVDTGIKMARKWAKSVILPPEKDLQSDFEDDDEDVIPF